MINSNNILKIRMVRNCFIVFLIITIALLTACAHVRPVKNDDFSGRGGKYSHSNVQSPSRGLVNYIVYLPPSWKQSGQETYPLIIFLHGRFKNEYEFPMAVPASQLNDWINEKLIPPMVIIAIRAVKKWFDDEQWSTPSNQIFLTSNSPFELRDHCRNKFRAGVSARTTSIHGFSRGASGALHYALKYPNEFASSISNSFVSDYALKDEMPRAVCNKEEVVNSGIFYRLSIGTKDELFHMLGRNASQKMHELLECLKIPHEYEVLSGAKHYLKSVWNARRSDGTANGLYELKMHAKAWNSFQSLAHQSSSENIWDGY